MKKILITALLLLSLSAFAQQKPVVNSSTPFFTGNELSASLGFNYSDAVSQKFSPLLGLTYYVTKNIGVRGLTTLNTANATAFDNGEFVGLLRLPIGPVSPYIGGGARYQASSSDKWSEVLDLGVEVRLNKHWGAFAELQHDFQNGKNLNYKDNSLRVGLNLTFK
jgi:outer membrane protein W